MRFLILFLLFLRLITLSTSANAEATPSEALKVMKHLIDRVDQGMSANDFIVAFPETEFDVKVYLAVAPDSPLKERIAAALQHMKTSARVCRMFSDNYSVYRSAWTLDSSWNDRYPNMRKSESEGGIFHTSELEQISYSWYTVPELFSYVFDFSRVEIVAAEKILSSPVKKKKKKGNQ